MKRLELALTVLLLPLDYCLIILAGLTAYSLRYTSFITAIRPILFDLSFEKFLPILLVVALGWVAIFAFSGLYRTNPNRKLARDISKIIMACSTGFAGIAIYLFFTLQKFDSRFLVLTSWILAIIYVSLGRVVMRGVRSLFYRFGLGLRKTVIIGNETIAETIKTALLTEPRLGYRITGTYTNFSERTKKDLLKNIPDELILSNPRADENETLSAVEFCNEHHITFKYSADLFATISSNMSVSTIAGIPIIELRRTRLSGWGRVFKRSVDIVGSLFFILLLWPFYIITALSILLETGRPVIYRNERVGQYGRKFFTLKFRSMYQALSTGEQFGASGEKALKEEAKLIKTSSIKNGPVYKIQNDPRVTPFGRFIRRWSIDELPQFFNVLKGDMSLVGPRPHQPREVDRYETHHKIVLAIKPGITGIAQISGRSNLSFEEEVRLDTFYIENWSLLMDMIILLKTPFVVLLRKGAW
jgi:exopolysaccharide biosynthesis polyprenyl glycosylphosphotransferase